MPGQIEEIKSALDIVQVIGERVSLTRAGKNFKGLCPFHSEKTGSFFVTPDIQRYKCFGCGRSGDVFTFVQEFESLTFAEALQQLATKAGITLEKHQFSPEDRRRERLLEMMSLAKEYFHYLLTTHKLGEPARKYLEERGVRKETIETFQLGYSLQSWDALQQYLVGKKHFTVQEMIATGLSISRDGGNGSYDRFRGRLMFPLTDAQGRVLGFSGRTLEKDTKEAKYINSPETELYHKSELLFGYSTLKNFIRKEEEVLIVEGEFDALSSYQAGVEYVVAIKGSAIGEKQVRLLSRSAKRIVLALDADAAGVEATKRAIQVAKPFDINLRVLPLVGGKDPDDLARANPKAWRELVKQTVPVFEFLLDSAFKKFDAKSGEGKRSITKEILPILAGMENAVEQAHYIERTAKQLGVKQEALETELNKFMKRNVVGATQQTQQTPATQTTQSKQPTKLETYEKYLLIVLLHMEGKQFSSAAEELQREGLTQPQYIAIFEKALAFAQKQLFNMQNFSKTVPEELQQQLAEIYLSTENDDVNLEKEFAASLKNYVKEKHAYLFTRLAKRMAELEEKERLSDKEQEEFVQIQKKFQSLGANSVE